MRSIVLLWALALGADGFAVTRSPALPLQRNAAAAPPLHRCATPLLQGAYDPNSASKSRPKKQKEPKQKVKGPVTSTLPPPELIFWEGAPSPTELIIPGVSIITVVGLIPFSAALARQAWTRYKLTTRRLEVAAGFQGKDVVQAQWKDVTDVKWLRRYGGVAGDMVLTLADGAKLELRSLPEFDRNLAFLMGLVEESVPDSSGYPDGPAKEFQAKLTSGEEPALEPKPAEEAAAE